MAFDANTQKSRERHDGFPTRERTPHMAQRSLLVRALWFLVVGWWVTPIVISIAWLCNVTIILLPVGLKLITLVPTVLTLREPRSVTNPEAAPEQPPLLIRAVYFVFIGWWFSLLWSGVASLLSVSILGLPIAIWMLNRLPFVTSLYRYR